MKSDFQKQGTPRTAIERVCHHKYFIFKKERLTAEFTEFLAEHARLHPRNYFLRECLGFPQFTYFYYENHLNTRHLRNISTELVIVGFQKILDFYGKRVIRRNFYGMKNKVNTDRMKDAEFLCDDLMTDIVRVNSAGLWELKKSPRYGYYIHQHTLDVGSPIDVINHNQWIAHNIGLVMKLNSMYNREDSHV